MTALLEVLRPKGRRRGRRQILRVTLADPGRRRRTGQVEDPFSYDPWEFL